MAKTEPVGHIACPICDHKDAEVKADKNGHLYIWCPDCSTQLFSRGCEVRQGHIRRKMRPLAGPAPVPQPQPAAKADPKPNTPPPAAAPVPKKPASSGLIL